MHERAPSARSTTVCRQSWRALLPALLACVALGSGTSHAAAAAPLELASAARSILGAGQGLYVEDAAGTVLVAQAADTAVHPASVSKVPTTLALLSKLGPDYRFTTTFAANGPIAAERLEGDLRVESDGNPALVDEDAVLIAARLRALGIRRIEGRLLAPQALLFDWQSDPQGERLRNALAGQVAPAAWAAVRALPADASLPALAAEGSPPALMFAPEPMAADRSGPARPLLVHRSESLIGLVKALNDYSNNIFNALAASVGGAVEVEHMARSALPPDLRGALVLKDAAGADAGNRMSPHVAVALLRAVERELGRSGHRLTDVLPVSGVDPGTLHDRLDDAGQRGCVVGKTGTYGDYGASALIGALQSAEHGTVYFAILNHGVPVAEARRRQDRFVQLLLRRLRARPWSYQRDARPAIARIELITPSS
jgi:D-alanyl-D-alanine carboxypeptidase/D-alanyl-D-alanine-endopeptidase (penicillin-binding protein 4)